MQILLKGGLDMYFDGNTQILIAEKDIHNEKLYTLGDLINYLQVIYAKSQNTLFRNINDLAPGNLCFINKIDYEILALINSKINFGDEICFISTMHGG
ncbi:Ubiquitin- modifier 1 [Conglomerata obtusa]